MATFMLNVRGFFVHGIVLVHCCRGPISKVLEFTPGTPEYVISAIKKKPMIFPWYSNKTTISFWLNQHVSWLNHHFYPFPMVFLLKWKVVAWFTPGPPQCCGETAPFFDRQVLPSMCRGQRWVRCHWWSVWVCLDFFFGPKNSYWIGKLDENYDKP